jgi:hypothetical protein
MRATRFMRATGCCVLAALTAATAAAFWPTAASAVGFPGWRLVLTVRPPAGYPARDDVSVDGISAPSASDVWAVAGVDLSSTDGAAVPLVEHWNGRTWSQVRLPGSWYAPFSIAASSSTNVWVSGSTGDGNSPGRPSWAHWNGATWTSGTLPVPQEPAGTSTSVEIDALVAPSVGEVWVAGYTVTDYPGQIGSPGPFGFLTNYDGHAWRTYQVDAVAEIDGLSALGPADVWAAGSAQQDFFTNWSMSNALLHWTGASWRSVPVPADQQVTSAQSTLEESFDDVVATSAHGAWVVGDLTEGPHAGYSGPGAAYWNGSRWTVYGLPAQPQEDETQQQLMYAAPDGSGGLWAIMQGASELSTTPEFWRMSHGRWTRVPVPGLSATDEFTGIATAPGTGSVWATGGGPSTGLIFGYGG